MVNCIKNNILYIIIILVVCFIFKNEISLILMYIVDCIGYTTGANVVNIIDMLNTIYYL